MTLFSQGPVVATRAPWTTKELWGGFVLALLFYIGGSLGGGLLLNQLDKQDSPWMGVVLAPLQLLMVLPPLVIMARYGNPLLLLGLNRFRVGMVLRILEALGVAFCGMILWGSLLLPFGIQQQEPLLPRFGEGGAALASVFVVAAILAPLVEETLFRGFLFGGLRERIGPGRAALVSGALFGAIHLQPYAFPALFLLGVLLALLYQRTGSLWPPILMHFCINSVALLAQFALYGQG